ncbi:MAG: PQQ-binding-like beta-propeller repeat protein [Thermoanaerobaculia bacterium]|nr:PQQ-binding-like beta-propeller repeat protein [Thermoanaerobaculia bacterium]
MKPAWSLLLLAVLLAPTAGRAADPSFSEEQARRGRALYLRHCSDCHGARMEGEHLVPSLVGSRFDQSFRGKSAGILAFHLRRMPPDPRAGTLGDAVYAEILAHLLASNGFEASDTPLPVEVAALDELTIPRREGQEEIDPYEPVKGGAQSPLLANLTPVTEAMLRDPSPDDWLHTQANYGAHTFSALDAIDRDTVRDLTIAWRAPLRPGNNMPMPIVHAGVMFLHTFPDTVVALDATSGHVLWRYAHESSDPSSQKMGLALAGGLVLAPTSDKHVIALDARTGELVWDQEIRLETPAMKAAYQLRSAPFVVGDKVIQGMTASFIPKGGALVGLDLETGKETWRFNTIARPGEAYGESWNDVPLEKRSGGSIWHQGSYDPELNLVYFGIAPTYDTGPLVHPVDKEGISSEALYTNCTVALNPDTGELVWHYQHMENDQWDLDWVFERQIATVTVDGAPRKVVMNVGKMAILEAVDAATGEYVFSVDAGIQNVITAIDPETGAKTIDPERWPDPERPTDICPSAFGARSWPPTSFNPETQMLYLPLTESCMRLGKEGARLLTSGVGIGPATHPDADDGIGRLQAIDVANQKLAWQHEQETAISTGALATAGGVVFAGDLDPSLKAYHDETGEVLWQARLDDYPSSSVITYKVGGIQYVAVVVGVGNFHIGALTGSLGALGGGSDGGGARGGAAVWVFAL